MVQFLFDLIVFVVMDIIVGGIKWLYRGAKRIVKKR